MYCCNPRAGETEREGPLSLAEYARHRLLRGTISKKKGNRDNRTNQSLRMGEQMPKAGLWPAHAQTHRVTYMNIHEHASINIKVTFEARF